MYAAVNSVSYSVVPGLSVGIADSSMLDGQLTFSIAVTVAGFSYVGACYFRYQLTIAVLMFQV